MRTHVTFLSDAFNRTEEKENFLNPCCFGEDLVRWMIPRFAGTHLKIDPDPRQEDWGWKVLVSCEGRQFLIGVGQYEVGRESGWLCFVESRLPFFKKWVGANDSAEQQQVCAALHSVLSSSPEIRDIRWYPSESFTKGKEADWKTEPGTS